MYKRKIKNQQKVKWSKWKENGKQFHIKCHKEGIKSKSLCHGQFPKLPATPPSPPPLATNRFTLEQHLFFRFISRVSVSLCQLSAAAAFTSCFLLCFIFHTIRHATHVRHAPYLLPPPLTTANVSFIAAPKDLFASPDSNDMRGSSFQASKEKN